MRLRSVASTLVIAASLLACQSFQPAPDDPPVPTDILRVAFSDPYPVPLLDSPPAKPKARSERLSAPDEAPEGHWTRASFTRVEPAACWDDRGRHAFPDGLALWTAHRTYPCGTRVRVWISPSRSVVVRVFDRGPYVAGRTFDLSVAAFQRLAPLSEGVIRVRWEVM